MPLGKLRFLCIGYFSKTKSKPAKKITGQCFSTEMEVTCENSANLEQETKTIKIVTYPLFPLAFSNTHAILEKPSNLANIIKQKTCTVFLSSYKNTSGSLGEREMLWEHELQVSVATPFSSSPSSSQFCVSIELQKHDF